ncbi:hypothetical protein GCM10009608_54190 [Pseudonocardia alaniniphila]
MACLARLGRPRRPLLALEVDPGNVEYVDASAGTKEQVIAVLTPHCPGQAAGGSELRGDKPRPRERSAAA